MKCFQSFSLVILSLFIQACDPNHAPVAQNILEKFGGMCDKGLWTTSALAHTEALISTMEDVNRRAKEACLGIEAALASANDFQFHTAI